MWGIPQNYDDDYYYYDYDDYDDYDDDDVDHDTII